MAQSGFDRTSEPPGTRITVSQNKYIVPEEYYSHHSHELHKLIRKHSRLIQNFPELKEIIEQHPKLPFLFGGALAFGTSLNFGYLAFLATTGTSGIEKIAQLFRSDVQVPSEMAYLAMAMGFFDVMVYVLAFSPKKEALTTTLDFLEWRLTPLNTRICETAKFFCKKPHLASLQALFELTLLNFNFASMMTVLIGFSEYIDFKTFVGLSLPIFFFGNLYMSKYSNQEARDGVQFWLSDQPSSFNRLRQGKLTLFIENIFRTFSTFLNAYPLYFAIGDSIAKSYNASPLQSLVYASITATMSWARGMLVFYPPIYNQLYQPSLKLNALIKKLDANHIQSLSVVDANHHIQRRENEFKQSVYEKKSRFKLLTENSMDVIRTTSRSVIAVSAIILLALSLLEANPLNFFIIGVCLISAFTAAKTSIDRNSTLQAIKDVEAKLAENKFQEDSLSCMDKCVDVNSSLLSINSGLSNLIVVMGSFGVGPLMLLLCIPAIEQMFTLYDLNHGKIKDTLNSMRRMPVSQNRSILFAPRRETNSVEVHPLPQNGL